MIHSYLAYVTALKQLNEREEKKVKIIGTEADYMDQTQSGFVEATKDYGKKMIVSCGCFSSAMGFKIAGWPQDIYTPGVLPGDAIMMLLHNPFNLDMMKKARNLNYDKFPPNEIQQTDNALTQILYDEIACSFKWGLNFDIIKRNIDNGIPMKIAGKFPCGGHFVLITGYDEERQIVKINDPYPGNYKDSENGYNREITLDFIRTNIGKWRTDFYPYPG